MIELFQVTITEKGMRTAVLGQVGGYEVCQLYARTAAGNVARISCGGEEQATWCLEVPAEPPVPKDTANTRITVIARTIHQTTIERVIDCVCRRELIIDPNNLPTEYLRELKGAERLFFASLANPI